MPPGTSVSLRASPPLVGMTHICDLPASSGRTNERCRPSCENRGLESLVPLVNGADSPDASTKTMICERASMLFRSTWERTKATLEPSGDSEGEATLTSSYTRSGVIEEGMAESTFKREC